MPRVKPLAKQDPRETAILTEIGGIMTALHISQGKLAEMAGIKESTLSKRLRKHGDLGSMRLSELWAIQDVGKRNGVGE